MFYFTCKCNHGLKTSEQSAFVGGATIMSCQSLLRPTLNGLRSRQWLTDMCMPVSTVTDRSCLLSLSRRDLRIPRSRLSRNGSRKFAVSGPAAWNSLLETYPHRFPVSAVVLKLNYLAGPMALTYFSTFMITFAMRMDEQRNSRTELNWDPHFANLSNDHILNVPIILLRATASCLVVLLWLY